MKSYLMCILLLISHLAVAQNKAEKAILETLSQQIKAWNEGDTKTFMIGYWENDSLMFIGKSGITFSHRETLARYQKNYPDKATMGTLKFDILRMKPLGRKNYFVVGKWHLTRPEKGDVGGHFTLVFEKIKGIWVIIADHSS